MRRGYEARYTATPRFSKKGLSHEGHARPHPPPQHARRQPPRRRPRPARHARVRHAGAHDRRRRRGHRHHVLRRRADARAEVGGRYAGRARHRRGPDARRGHRREAARRGRRAPARAASSRWRCRPSTSRCGTSRARRWARRSTPWSAAPATASTPTPPARSCDLTRLDYLRDAGPRLVEMGFKQMKTQLGCRADGRAVESSASARCARASAKTST